MRRGEVAGLRWSDVGLEAGRVSPRRPRVVVNYEVHSHVLPGLDAQAAGTVARLILGDSEQEPARPVDKALTTGPWAGRTRKEVKREPAGQEKGDRRDLNPRPSGPQSESLVYVIPAA